MSKEGASMILKSWLIIVTAYVFRTSKGTVHSFCFRDHPYISLVPGVVLIPLQIGRKLNMTKFENILKN